MPFYMKGGKFMKRLLPVFILLLFPMILSAQLTFQFDSIIPSPQMAGDSFQIFVSCSDSTFTNWVYLDLHPGGQAYMNPAQILIQNGYGNGYATVFRAQNPCSLSVYLIASDRFYSNSFAVNANVPQRIQALLPGEAPDPGRLPRGRTGQPDFQTAGIPFLVDIYVTDYWWNPVGFGSDTVNFTSDNPFPILPPDTSLTNGAGQFSCILRTACDITDPSTYYHIFASHITSGTPFMADTTTRFAVQPGVFDRLLLIAPSQSVLAGDTTSNTILLPGATPDTADWQIAGTPFDVTVYAADNCWNPVGSNAPQDTVRVYGTIQIYTLADTIVLTGGQATATLMSNVSGDLYLQAEDLSSLAMTTKYSTRVKIAGSRYELQADEENQTIVSGSDIHLHIYYVDESGNRITDDDHNVVIYVYSGSGTLAPSDSVIRSLSSGMVEPTVQYSTSQAEDLYLRVSPADTQRRTGPGTNVDPIHVIPTVAPGGREVTNFPNPFGHDYRSTTIYYWLESPCDVVASIYDRFGNLVKEWPKEARPTGANYLTWDGRNNRGVIVANGAYLLAIRATSRTTIVHDYRRWLAVVK
jgi:hypothetical protein